MAIAGYCSACGQYVYLNEYWGCVNGHAWDQMSNWYDPETGAPVTPYWLQPGYAPAPQPAPQPAVQPAAQPEPQPAAPQTAAEQPAVADARITLLATILQTLGQYPGYQVRYGTDTDIVIDNQVANANWAGGKKKIEYSAVLKAVEPERTVYFWEMLKESGAGLSFGGFESESYSTFGTKRSGKKKDIVIGPGGVEVNAEWDYGATRGIIESVAASQGWNVKTVLRKQSASW